MHAIVCCIIFWQVECLQWQTFEKFAKFKKIYVRHKFGGIGDFTETVFQEFTEYTKTRGVPMNTNGTVQMSVIFRAWSYVRIWDTAQFGNTVTTTRHVSDSTSNRGGKKRENPGRFSGCDLTHFRTWCITRGGDRLEIRATNWEIRVGNSIGKFRIKLVLTRRRQTVSGGGSK